MAEYLVIRLGSNPQQSAHWIIALVPAETVLTTSVDLPIKSGARLRAALPFALEEQLAEDVENLHFASGRRDDNGLLPVAVVADEQMREWLTTLEAAGIFAEKIIPENHGLAKIPGTMSLLVADDYVMLNDGAATEFVMQGVKPSEAIAVTGALDESESQGHLLVYCEPADETRFEHDWNALRNEMCIRRQGRIRPDAAALAECGHPVVGLDDDRLRCQRCGLLSAHERTSRSTESVHAGVSSDSAWRYQRDYRPCALCRRDPAQSWHHRFNGSLFAKPA
jgi:type II secretion system protein L